MPNVFHLEAIYDVLYTMLYQFVNCLNVELISLALYAQEHNRIFYTTLPF
jgi:hypothetical protein